MVILTSTKYLDNLKIFLILMQYFSTTNFRPLGVDIKLSDFSIGVKCIFNFLKAKLVVMKVKVTEVLSLNFNAFARTDPLMLQIDFYAYMEMALSKSRFSCIYTILS